MSTSPLATTQTPACGGGNKNNNKKSNTTTNRKKVTTRSGTRSCGSSSSEYEESDQDWTLGPQTNLRMNTNNSNNQEKENDDEVGGGLVPSSLLASSRVSGSRRSRSNTSSDSSKITDNTNNTTNENEDADGGVGGKKNIHNNNSRRVTFDSNAMKASTVHKTLNNSHRISNNSTAINGNQSVIYVGDSTNPQSYGQLLPNHQSTNNNTIYFSPKPKTPTKSMMFEEEEGEGNSDNGSGEKTKSHQQKGKPNLAPQVDQNTPPNSQDQQNNDDEKSSNSALSWFTTTLSNTVKTVFSRFSSSSSSLPDDEEQQNQKNQKPTATTTKNMKNFEHNIAYPSNLKFVNAIRKPVRRDRNSNNNSTTTTSSSSYVRNATSNHNNQENNNEQDLNMRRKSNNNNSASNTVGWDDALYPTRKQCCQPTNFSGQASSSQRNTKNKNTNNTMKKNNNTAAEFTTKNQNRNDDDDDEEEEIDFLMVNPSRLTKTPLFSAQILSKANQQQQNQQNVLTSFKLEQHNKKSIMNTNTTTTNNSSSNNNNNNQISKKDSKNQQQQTMDPRLLEQLLENDENVLAGILEKISATAVRRAVKTQVESSHEAVNRIMHSVVRRIVIDEIQANSVRPVLSINQRVEQNKNQRDYARTDLVLQTNNQKADVSALSKILAPAGNNDGYHIGNKIAGYQMTARDFVSLRPGNWCTDMIVNCYIYLALSAEHLHYRRPSLRNNMNSAILLNSHFYANLRDKGYADAKRLTIDDDIFAARLILIPINHNNSHWMLLSVDVCERRFCFWDSLGSNGKQHLDRVRDFFQTVWEERQTMRSVTSPLSQMSPQDLETLKTANTKKARRQRIDLLTPLPALPPIEWEIYTPRKNSPQQDNSVDCGVFTSQTAVHLIWGTSVWNSVKCDWMKNLRELMAVELSSGMMVPRC